MEVIIVIVILATGATLALIRFDSNAERTRAAQAFETLQTLREAQEIYKQENGAYTAVIGNLGVSIPPVEFFAAPQVSDTDVNALVSVARNSSNFRFGTAYTLRISQTGVITCAGSTYCTNLGF